MILPSLSIVPYAHNRAGNMFTQFPLDGGFTVSSSDQGTIVNANGIIERSPRNLCINTQTFTAASWIQTSSPTIADNAEIAPDGTMTAAVMTNGQIQYTTGIGVIGKKYTCSMYIRRISGTGTVRFRAIENINTDIIVTSEWQRFSLTVAATTTTLRIGINLELGTSTVAIWGAQIEESLTPTPYQRIDASRLNFPRIDWLGQSCPALLVEPSGSNGIRNNSMVGANVSTNTLPTNWLTTLNGLSIQVIAIGTETGVDYIDIKLSGTATSTVAVIAPESSTQIVAASGQTWTNSLYIKIISQPSPPSSYTLAFREGTSGGSFVNFGANTITPTTTLQRLSATRTLTGATTERVQPQINFALVSGSTYDFTVRIGWPQMEQSSVATSPIPTTSAAVSRAADVISASGALVSGLIGQTEGTLYAEIVAQPYNGALFPAILQVDDGADSQRFALFVNASGGVRLRLNSTNNNIGLDATSPTSLIAGQVYKIAAAFAFDGTSALYINGVFQASGSVASGPFSSALNRVNVGSRGGAFISPSRIRAAALYTTRLSNAQLELLTKL
jgi:hypothetical protein